MLSELRIRFKSKLASRIDCKFDESNLSIAEFAATIKLSTITEPTSPDRTASQRPQQNCSAHWANS